MGRETILIVEGEPSVAGDLKTALAAGGFEVPAVCRTGEEAVEQLAGLNPDLAIIDTIPAGKMNGIETANRIRKLAGIPVVFLAGYGDMEMLEKAKVTEQYVLKPFDERELLTAIKIAFAQHAMEQAVLENEKTVRALLDATTDPLFLLDSYGRFLALNGIMEQRLGVPAGEVLQKPITGFSGRGGVSPQLLEKIGTARTGKPVRFEENTGDRWYDTHVYPIADATGEVTRIAVFSHDITEQKKIVDELAVANVNLLQEQENLLIFTSAVDSMDDSVVITDAGGNIRYVNHAFEKKFGYTPEEVKGKHLSEFQSPESTFALERTAFLNDRKSVWTGNLVAKNRFGLKIALSLKSSPIMKDNQTVSRVFVLRERI